MTTHAFPTQNVLAQDCPKANIVAWVCQILVALAFLGAATMKLMGGPEVIAMFQKLGFGDGFRFLTAALEITGALLLLSYRTAFYGALVLILVMIGAIIAHLTVLGGNPLPAIILLLLSANIAFLRRPNLHAKPH